MNIIKAFVDYFMHNVEKWPNILKKLFACKNLDFNITHKSVKEFNNKIVLKLRFRGRIKILESQ